MGREQDRGPPPGRTSSQNASVGFGALHTPLPVVAPAVRFEGATGLAEKVDLRRWCSPVMNQLPNNACNACSLSGALEYAMKHANQPEMQLSMLFIYYNGRKIGGIETKDDGMVPAHAAAAIIAYGVCEERYWPHDPTHVNEKPPQNAYENARALGTMVQYGRVEGIEGVKASLNREIPVIVPFGIPKAYYENTGPTGKLPALGSYDEQKAGHSLLVVGYDDATKVWIVKNSFGAAWGDKGYGYVPYDLADKFAWTTDMWVIGNLNKPGVTQLVGASISESVAHTQANGPAQTDAALAELRKSLRDELQNDLNDAKRFHRDQLRKDAEDVTARRAEAERNRRMPSDPADGGGRLADRGRGGGNNDDNNGGR